MNEVSPGIFVITESIRPGAVKPSVNIYMIAGPDGIIIVVML
jgi:hypothetical protein